VGETVRKEGRVEAECSERRRARREETVSLFAVGVEEGGREGIMARRCRGVKEEATTVARENCRRE
jgi:hypothetical protein